MSEKLAPCPLLYNASSRVYCTRPHDCFTCELMQQEIAKFPAEHVMWVCPSCISEVIKTAKSTGQKYTLRGFYTEGQCQYKYCEREARVEGNAKVPARFSRFLQLFIGA